MMRKTVPSPSEVPMRSVRAALQKMITDSHQAAPKEPCSERSLPPAAPPVSIAPSLGYANWRARSILREIASLESTSALADYEGDLREVLIFQEVRLRTKMFNRFLHEECFLVQKSEVERNEKRKRSSLEKDWFHTVVFPMHFMQFLFDEEVCRYNLLVEQGHLRSSLRLHMKLSVISIEERKSARFIQAAEILRRTELQQRRLMEVGQEIKYEILRQSLSETFRKLHRYALAFIKDHKNLLRAEERDRLAIEKMCFFSLDILMREETFNRTRILRDDVVHIGERKKQNDIDDAQVLALRDQQSIILHESQIRQMVVEYEQRGWEHVYSQFMLGWRDVYQRINVHCDVKILVSSLELFERRCIYDEYRKSLYDISNVYDYEHPIAQMHQKRYLQFFDDLLNGMSVIWVEESKEFAALKERYIAFEIEVKAIHRTRVLALEETVVRRQIEREELHQRKSRKLCSLREKCDLEAVNFARLIAMHEAYEWDLLMHNVFQQCIIVPQEEIRREEFLKRLEVESEEQHSHVQLLFEQEQCQYHGAVSIIASQLLEVENTCRFQVFQSERCARFALMRASFADVEYQCRRTLAREEKRRRIRLLTRATAGEDLVARHQLFQRYIAAVSGSKLALLQNCEETSRASIIKSEKSRRNFLVSSIPYEHLYLRACEVDELAARLEIITEAELCIRSCAYTQGHDAHVAYCDSALRVLQAQLHFQSLSELFEDMERQLVHEIEPIMRRRINEEQFTSLLFLKLAFEEGSCRQHLFYSEASGWDSMEKLAKRILGRQNAWETRALLSSTAPLSLSHREELLSYLQKQQKISYVEELVQKKRRLIRSRIAVFMDELYWCRDAILREEECVRCGVMYSYEKEGSFSTLSSSFEGEKQEKRDENSSAFDNGRPEKTLHESPNLFIHSLVLYRPPKEVEQVATLAISYTGESSLYRVPLRPAYHHPVSGNHRKVWAPSVLHSWLPENVPFAGVIYFSLLDVNEKAIITASHLLKQEEKESEFLSVDLDSYSGKLYLTKCMYCPSEGN